MIFFKLIGNFNLKTFELEPNKTSNITKLISFWKNKKKVFLILYYFAREVFAEFNSVF